jgi:hypothetical protein
MYNINQTLGSYDSLEQLNNHKFLSSLIICKFSDPESTSQFNNYNFANNNALNSPTDGNLLNLQYPMSYKNTGNNLNNGQSYPNLPLPGGTARRKESRENLYLNNKSSSLNSGNTKNCNCGK